VTRFGAVELAPDRARPGGWTLLVDGVAQSYVDLEDPTYLKFEYVRRVASVIDTVAPAGEPLRVLHLGGGALTLARYVAVTRPGSAQRVVERDEALDALVRRELPLPPGCVAELTVDDARAFVESSPGGAFDLVIGDVYSGAQMPPSVASLQFAREVARVGARYALNVADLPPLMFTRIQAATLRMAFPDVCLIASSALLRGRRYGNAVLVGGGALPLARLRRIAARDERRGRVLHGVDLTGFIGGIGPMVD
jgi:hypothetical protein